MKPTFKEVLAAAPEPTEHEYFVWCSEYAKSNPPPEKEQHRNELEAANIAVLKAAGKFVLHTGLRFTNAERKYTRERKAAWEQYVRDVYKPKWAMSVINFKPQGN